MDPRFGSSHALPGDIARALQATEPARGRFGAPVVFLPETSSTNDVAAQLAEQGAPEGTVVLAAAQTAGRGRMGRRWFSPPGAGLYASVVVRGAAAPLLTLAAGVAVAEGVRRTTGLPAVIKWPNDVVLADSLTPGGGRKLAGVLAEGSTAGGVLQYVVVGVGVNLREAAYPPEIASRATSLEAELGRVVPPGPVLAGILAALNEQVSQVRAGERAGLLNRWRELAPSAQGSVVEWSAAGAPRRGTTAGIDADGALLIRTPTGTERLIAGELVWR